MTEIEPWLAYILSPGRSHRLEANLDALRTYLEDILVESGVTHIVRDWSIFGTKASIIWR
ncbi:MAG: hypothetical protein JXA97_10610 [Anaerolineales bacterium]|nr:hypothetical protein [Anaerolineales bacterium]